ncbi:hypothetical protein DFAR_1990010 [Desulfarculales bacterium]
MELTPPREGCIIFEGQEVAGANPHLLAR